MENLISRAVGYLTVERDIPAIGLCAGDRVYFDVDADTKASQIIAVWDDQAHICTYDNQGGIFDWGFNKAAPENAVVIGGALYVSRDISGRKEAGHGES